MQTITENYDVVVVGAGHAGCEAALACARMGLETIIFTVSIESIALMPCNPNVGGSSKGHLVRELDALGGEMGKNIDATFIQSKMLNKSKGPAVHSLRAQADKAAYTQRMRSILERQEHLTIRQQEVAEILTSENSENLQKCSPEETLFTISDSKIVENVDNITLTTDSYTHSQKKNTENSGKLSENSAFISHSIAFDRVDENNCVLSSDDNADNNSASDSENESKYHTEIAAEAMASGSYSTVEKQAVEAVTDGSYSTVEKQTVEVLTDGSYSTVEKQAVEVLTDGSETTEEYLPRIIGIRTVSGAVYYAKSVILCTGVYLKSRCIYGDVSQYTGPNGLMPANHLSDSLIKNGIKLTRFKTGTPARIDKRSIDFSKCVEQKGDERVIPFSFETDPETVQIEQESCWLTYTNTDTHRIIRENIDRSPLYGGVIKSTGPRYCPSIEDKVMKFADKDRHQVFIEPEGRYTQEMYIDGMSSSMPEDVQFAMYRSVPGLENARITRNAYAIEYDCLAPKQLKSSLEFKAVRGLFSGGQFNGSSGYEEAAAQGLIAGINAGRYIQKKEPLVLLRSEAYIGVLIDDLVTKENFEPYRMMTSRAEYRLLLRQDNADLRLRKYGYEVGLISREQMDAVELKEKQIRDEIERVSHLNIGTGSAVQELMARYGSTPLETGATMAELIRRPELDYEKLAPIDLDRPDLPERVREQVNIEICYEGYIQRQKRQVEAFAKTENRKIPENLNYDDVSSLRLEARQKLKSFRPESIGQASRIAGVSPSDISVLLVYLKKKMNR